MSLMGLDVGITGCKAIIFDLDGKTIASAYREYPLLHPQPGWPELDIHNLNPYTFLGEAADAELFPGRDNRCKEAALLFAALRLLEDP